MDQVLKEIRMERKKQDEKWGETNHHPLVWISIIGEEYGEVCKALNEYSSTKDSEKLEEMIRETVQVAACCVAMIESLQRQINKGLMP